MRKLQHENTELKREQELQEELECQLIQQNMRLQQKLEQQQVKPKVDGLSPAITPPEGPAVVIKSDDEPGPSVKFPPPPPPPPRRTASDSALPFAYRPTSEHERDSKRRCTTAPSSVVGPWTNFGIAPPLAPVYPGEALAKTRWAKPPTP